MAPVTRWRGNPDDGSGAGSIQFAKQPWTGHDLRQRRRREFARERPIPIRGRGIHPLRHGLVPNEQRGVWLKLLQVKRLSHQRR